MGTDSRSILVTGGAGFIGSHLCELLLARGFGVRVVDDLRTGTLDNLPLGSQDVRFEQIRVGDPSCVERLEQHVIESCFVFHLASPVGVSTVSDEPGMTLTSIIEAGSQIVELCRRHRRPLLFTSSSEVYGPAPPCPTTEECALALSAAPRFSYAVAKLAVEHLVIELFRRHRVPAWVVRLFNIAGPRQRADAGVVSAFSAELVSGRGHIRIHGDGTQTRSFLHVSDAARALARIGECSALCGRAVNLGSEAAITIRELADLVQSEVRRHALYSLCSYEAVFGAAFTPVVQRQPNTRLLREATGWQPKLALTDIVHDCVEHARRSVELASSSGQSV
jgi:UDP-glucose 4-epimerase